MKEIVIDGVEYILTPKEEVLVFGLCKIGSCVVSLKNLEPCRKKGDVFKILENSREGYLYYREDTCSTSEEFWRPATEEETAGYEKRGGVYNISELKKDKNN